MVKRFQPPARFRMPAPRMPTHLAAMPLRIRAGFAWNVARFRRGAATRTRQSCIPGMLIRARRGPNAHGGAGKPAPRHTTYASRRCARRFRDPPPLIPGRLDANAQTATESAQEALRRWGVRATPLRVTPCVKDDPRPPLEMRRGQHTPFQPAPPCRGHGFRPPRLRLDRVCVGARAPRIPPLSPASGPRYVAKSRRYA